jgi:hypothetical protein
MKRPMSMPPPVKRHIFAGVQRGQSRDAGLAEKIDDRAADGDFAADIHENGDDSQPDVGKLQRSDLAFDLSPADVRQVNEEKNCGQDYEDPAECQIRHLDRIRPVRSGPGKVLEDQISPDQRPDGGADRIKSLRQIQPAGRGPLRSQDGHIRVGGNLQHGKPETHHKQRDQKQGIGNDGGRRPEQDTAQRGNQETEDNAILVANARNGVARRHRNHEIQQRPDKVGPEEGQLHQHRLEIIQRERLLEPRNQDVIEHRHEPPQEKEDRHDRERPAIRLTVARL